ncbi:dTMP kinase [Paenibacillus sp. SC116]|uniref:dTMP kinase n=1 Tax=Paenibacillus sp. SC116 TaxID=2968986 RepID=UPI00215A580F|nr:dTMP kinase [Paenibacillus sp. SC116]MCR8846670.1 dTMP kinase [Paenibacillus sp. SC116]
MVKRGLFITLEGGEGAGKSTAIRLLQQQLEELGQSVVVTREPGGIHIAERIREVILDKEHTAMDARTEALLYAAARRQHLVEKVRPALETGAVVLCDRFVDSSLAYQGHARGLGVDAVWEINRFAIHDLMPDITFWLDIDPAVGLARIAANAEREINRLDQEGFSFHEQVRAGYQLLAVKYPERIVRIDASADPQSIATQMLDILRVRTRN